MPTIIFPEKRIFVVGLELGRPMQGSALSVVEVIPPAGYEKPPYPNDMLKHHLRSLQRFSAGPKYTDMGQSINDVLIKIKCAAESEEDELPSAGPQPLDKDWQPLPARKRRRKVDLEIHLVVDQTAVGEPIVESIERKLGGKKFCKVVIRGQRASYSDGLYQIPKQDLVDGLLALSEEGRFKAAQNLDLCGAFTQELMKYRDRPRSAAPSNTDGPWREFPEDDLIFAAAIACWKSQNLPFFDWDGL